MDRPSTSKPRGVCKYYKEPRGCFAGRNCKFLHGEPPEERLTPYDESKTCRYFAQGFCKRGETCWFLHVRPNNESSSRAESSTRIMEQDSDCGICYEKPVTYGLLEGCSHVFCITCIRGWRSSSKRNFDAFQSPMTKKCPLCRVPFGLVTPSSLFYPSGHPEKSKVISRYRDSMKRVPCQHFEKSKTGGGPLNCPFRNDCYYQHLNDDGSRYEFPKRPSRPPWTNQFELSFSMANQIQAIRDTLEELDGVQHLGDALDLIRTGLGSIGLNLERIASRPRRSRGRGNGVDWGTGVEWDDWDWTPSPEMDWNQPQGDDDDINERTAGEFTSLETLVDNDFTSFSDVPHSPQDSTDGGEPLLADGINEDDSNDDDHLDMPALEPITSHNTVQVIGGECRADFGVLGNETQYESDVSPSLEDGMGGAFTCSAGLNRYIHPPSVGSPRFSTTVNRRANRVINSDLTRGFGDSVQPMIIEISDEEQEDVEDARDGDESFFETSPPMISPLSEPPFVTDGRGRVVWSSSGAGPPSMPSAMSDGNKNSVTDGYLQNKPGTD